MGDVVKIFRKTRSIEIDVIENGFLISLYYDSKSQHGGYAKIYCATWNDVMLYLESHEPVKRK